MLKKYVPIGFLAMLIGIAASPAHPTGSNGPTGATYASLAKLPDWSGTWAMSDREFQASGKIANQAPYKPAYLQTQTGATSDTGKPNASKCLPSGMPGIMGVPLGFEFVFSPGRVTILTEEGPMIRRIYTDGRKHADDPVPTYAGDSVGHWDGSALVVDTVAITPKAEFIKRVKTSGQTHVTERIYLADHAHLRVDTTIEDPVALNAPWSYSWTYERSNTGFVESYYCDDDRDANGEPDLTPPPVQSPPHSP
jgi:hypothetical protein